MYAAGIPQANILNDRPNSRARRTYRDARDLALLSKCTCLAVEIAVEPDPEPGIPARLFKQQDAGVGNRER